MLKIRPCQNRLFKLENTLGPSNGYWEMKKTVQSNSNQHVPGIYDQVAMTNQSSSEVSETDTDILSPNFQFSKFHPSDDALMEIDIDDGKNHRVDTQHQTTPHNHLSLRLQKFIKLTEQYVQEEEGETINQQATTSVVQPAKQNQTFRAKADWQVQSKHQFVTPTAQPAKQNVAPRSKPKGESSLGSQSVKIRIDSGPRKKAPHFITQPETTTSTTEPQTQTKSTKLERKQSGLLWSVNVLQWPSITDQLLQEPSLTIDRIGNNVSKLMTGDQNRLIVTSAKRGEGSSTLSISIARWARANRRQVLLIDADLQDAGLTSSIGLGTEVSWLSTIDTPRNVGDVIIQDQESGMFVMPLSPLSDRSNLPSNIFQALTKMLEPICDCFDLVVMDMGPTQQFLNETSRVDVVADAAMLVNDVTQPSDGEFSRAKSSLLSAGIAKMIVAENFSNSNIIPGQRF